MMREDYQWVHEKDYGANPIGDFIVGIFLIITGVVGVIINLFRKEA